MTTRLEFDDRLLNRFAVEDHAHTHAPLHSALLAWFAAFGDFDDSSLGRLIAARSPQDIEKWRSAGQAALATIPSLVQALDEVRRCLVEALSATADFPERAQLEGLLRSAEINRVALVEHAPALVAQALGSGAAYGDARTEASSALERAAEKLEQLRARSEVAGQSYRELHPLVSELQSVGSELDRALSALSRPDQRALRAPHNARMRTAASALTRTLFLRKMEDRARAEWPSPEIAAPGDSAAERFAAALARADFAGARSLLAPWLTDEWTADRLAQALQDSARNAAAAFDLAEPPPPGAWQVGANPMRYEDVRALSDPIPNEITAQNFIGWFIIQIQPEEEDAYLTDLDTLADLFVVAVSTAASERIGYLRFGE